MLAVVDKGHDLEEDLLQIEVRPNFVAEKRLQQQQSRRENVHFGRGGKTYVGLKKKKVEGEKIGIEGALGQRRGRWY